MAAKTRKSRSITGKVLQSLLNSCDFENFIENNSESLNTETFIERFSHFCDSRNMLKSEVLKKSGIERTYGYQILRGLRSPTRDKTIQLAIGLSLNYDETQLLLSSARHSALYPRIKRDAAIIFCLNHGLSFPEVQSMLDELGEETLS